MGFELHDLALLLEDDFDFSLDAAGRLVFLLSIHIQFYGGGLVYKIINIGILQLENLTQNVEPYFHYLLLLQLNMRQALARWLITNRQTNTMLLIIRLI